MDRFWFVSDIHGNLEALQAVLKETRGGTIYCLGDMVGYGASPNEVVASLKEVDAVCLLGNHDEAALTGDFSRFNRMAAVAGAWTRRMLTDESRLYLRSLPTERKVDLAGSSAYLTHGSPQDNLWEYVQPSTHGGLFDFYLRELGVSLIGLGHTHQPYTAVEPNGRVFNPGSVGQPRDGDHRAAFSSLEIGTSGSLLVHRRVAYDLETASEKITLAGLPPQLASRLFRGI